MRHARLAALAAALGLLAGPALADLAFPSLSYRTGPYAAGGAPFADGYADYFTLLNERDGGIGGVKAVVPECETAYDTTKGVECYEQVRGTEPAGAAAAVDRDHLPDHPAGDRGQDPAAHHGLRPDQRGGRHDLRVGVQLSRHLLGRGVDHRERTCWTRTAAASRARRSRCSTTTRPTARSRSGRWRRWPRSTASRSRRSRSTARGRSRSRSGCRSGASGRTTC